MYSTIDWYYEYRNQLQWYEKATGYTSPRSEKQRNQLTKYILDRFKHVLLLTDQTLNWLLPEHCMVLSINMWNQEILQPNPIWSSIAVVNRRQAGRCNTPFIPNLPQFHKNQNKKPSSGIIRNFPFKHRFCNTLKPAIHLKKKKKNRQIW